MKSPRPSNSLQCFVKGGEEPDASAEAAAGRGLPGVPARRPGEGPQEEGGAGAAEARGGEGPAECSCRGEETTGESRFIILCACGKCSARSVYSECARCLSTAARLWILLNTCLFCDLKPQNLEEEKERKSECLPPEPAASDPESVKIVFKMPNDTRVERRFLFGQSLTVRVCVCVWHCESLPAVQAASVSGSQCPHITNTKLIDQMKKTSPISPAVVGLEQQQNCHVQEVWGVYKVLTIFEGVFGPKVISYGQLIFILATWQLEAGSRCFIERSSLSLMAAGGNDCSTFPSISVYGSHFWVSTPPPSLFLLFSR